MSRTRSVSQLEEYTKCGEAYRLHRVVGIKPKPAVYLEAGTAFHDTAELIDHLAHYEGIPALADAEPFGTTFAGKFVANLEAASVKTGVALNEFRVAGRVSAEKPNKEDAAWWLQAGQRMVEDYRQWRIANPHLVTAELPDGMPAVEINLRVQFGAVTVVGIPDQVLWDLDAGRYLVVDRKTGTREPKRNTQLSTYASGCRAAFGWDVQYGTFYMARKGTISVPRSLTLIHEYASLVSRFELMDRMENAGIYQANVTDDCTFCDMRQWCVYVGGDRHERDTTGVIAA